MNPKYVTSPETSMKLKEAGVPQNSEYYWFDNPNSGKMELLEKKYIIGIFDKFIFSAYLSDELGEILPWIIKIEIPETEYQTYEHLARLVITKSMFKYKNPFEAQIHLNNNIWHFEIGDTQAEAQGRILFYLIKHKLISFEAKASESEGVWNMCVKYNKNYIGTIASM